jgi:thioredoxin 1
MNKGLILTLIFATLIATGCKKELVDTSLNEITDVNDLTTLQSNLSEGVSLVFFHASWCAICEEQRPAVEAASTDSELSFVKFYEVEYDDNENIADHYDVPGFPQILIFKDGTEQERFKGKGHSQETLTTKLKSYQ